MTGSGRMTSEGKTILYSGHEEQYVHGVGMVLSKKAAAALTGWKPVSDHIITVHFQSPQVQITVVQVYAPTDGANETDKNAFYDQLQDVINDIPGHDVASDLNA